MCVAFYKCPLSHPYNSIFLLYASRYVLYSLIHFNIFPMCLHIRLIQFLDMSMYLLCILVCPVYGIYTIYIYIYMFPMCFYRLPVWLLYIYIYIYIEIYTYIERELVLCEHLSLCNFQRFPMVYQYASTCMYLL